MARRTHSGRPIRTVLAVAWLAALAIVTSACGGTQPGPAAPKGSGSLTILGTLNEDVVQGITKAYQSETGVKMSYVRLSGGEALAKLRADKANPQFSVWWGGSADGYIAAAKEGLLEPYKPKEFDKIQASYKDPKGMWTGFYVGVLGVGLNTKVLREKNLPQPTSWDDLAKPIYKGQISMGHPASSGTAYTTLATIIQLFGRNTPDKGFDYMRKLHKNVLQYQKAGAAPARQAGQGEVAIGIAFAHDIVSAIEAGFTDLKIIYPSEGTGYEVGAMGLVKGAPDPIEGKKFLDWSSGAHAQELLPKYQAFQLPAHPSAKVSAKSPKLSAVKVIDYDYEWAGNNKKTLVDRFSNEIAPAPR